MFTELSPSFVLLTGGVATGVLVVQAYRRYSRNARVVGDVPGLRTVVSITRPIMAVLPAGKFPYSTWFFSIGPDWWMRKGYETFRVAGQDIASGLSLDLFEPAMIVADAEAAQEIMANRARFRKPTELYGVLEMYGPNLITTEGDSWRIHRKITSPSFSENNNKLVCEETIFVMEGLFDIWKSESVVHCDVAKTTTALALMVICGAAFGKRVPWVDVSPPPEHQLTFKGAIETVSADLFIKAALPNIAMGMTARTSKVQLAFLELKRYIHEMIRERSKSYHDHSGRAIYSLPAFESDIYSPIQDLFSNLLAANENDDEGLRLTEEELVGNIFIFLIAGHETTAHTLAFAIGLLALYPEVQESLYQHVVETVADPSGAPSYGELNALTYATAVFYEALRLYPAVTVIPKRSNENTTLRTVNSKGEPVVVPIAKDVFVNIIVPALHKNPRYWKDPEDFVPERFLGDWPKQAFAPFAMGARSCIGRRFAEVEAIVALSMLVRNYRIEVQAEQLVAGETLQERRTRILAFSDILTLTPKHIPLTFSRR